MRTVRAWTGSFSHGVVFGLSRRALSAASTCAISLVDAAAGPNPPSRGGWPGSAITLSAAKARVLPRREQSSHAPYGLLKENERGSSSGTLVPHSTHASFREYRRSSP